MNKIAQFSIERIVPKCYVSFHFFIVQQIDANMKITFNNNKISTLIHLINYDNNTNKLETVEEFPLMSVSIVQCFLNRFHKFVLPTINKMFSRHIIVITTEQLKIYLQNNLNNY